MFGILPIISLGLAAFSSVQGATVPRRSTPSTYATGYLENYEVYHARYMAIGCQKHHGEKFFDDCCHPLLAVETLKEHRPAYCNPSHTASSSVVAKPTHVASPSTSSAKPSATVTPEDDDDLEYCDEDDDEDDEDLPYCDELPGHVSSTKVAPTPSATPTKPVPTSSTPVKSSTPKPDTTKAVATSTPAPAPTFTTPKQSSSPAPVPTTTTPKPTPTTKAQAPAQTPSSGGAVNSGGFATFYDQGGVAGACGDKHGDNEMIAAMNQARYGPLDRKSGLCGKQVKIINPKNNKSVVVTIADACPGCKNSNSIDLSRGAFNKIATEDEGMVGITWSFL